MSLTVEVFSEAGALLGTQDVWVEESAVWFEELSEFGGGQIMVPTDQAGLLRGRRLVRFTPAGKTPFLWQLQRPRQQRISATDEALLTVWRGQGALAVLGSGDWGGAVVEDRTVFGWIARNWDDSTWGDATNRGAFHTLLVDPTGWPDPFAQWIGSAPGNPTFARRFIDVANAPGGSKAGPARWFVVGYGNWRIWIDEREKASGEPMQVAEFRFDLTNDGHQIAMESDDGPILVAVMTEEKDEVLYRSSDGVIATFETQHVVVDAEAAPYPWGSTYPSPGGLTGNIYLTHNGNETTGIKVNEPTGTFDPADVKAALEALPSISTVTVSGAGTSANPTVITWDDPGPQTLLQLRHDELRHNHATTGVFRQAAGVVADDGPEAWRTLEGGATPVDVTWGWVMRRLIEAAQERGAIPAVTIDSWFDDHDSNDQPWQVGLPIWVVRGNELLGDVALSAAEAFGGVEVRMLADPLLELAAYDPSGSDLSATVRLTDDQDSDDPKNVSVINASVVSPPAAGTVIRLATSGSAGWVEDSALVAEFGRLELPMSVGTAETVEEVEVAAQTVIVKLSPLEVQEVTIWDRPGATFGIDFDLGDAIEVRSSSGTYKPFRVMRAGHAMEPGGEYVVDLIVQEVRVN